MRWRPHTPINQLRTNRNLKHTHISDAATETNFLIPTIEKLEGVSASAGCGCWSPLAVALISPHLTTSTMGWHVVQGSRVILITTADNLSLRELFLPGTIKLRVPFIAQHAYRDL